MLQDLLLLLLRLLLPLLLVLWWRGQMGVPILPVWSCCWPRPGLWGLLKLLLHATALNSALQGLVCIGLLIHVESAAVQLLINRQTWCREGEQQQARDQASVH
jgi:hypothetical protein